MARQIMYKQDMPLPDGVLFRLKGMGVWRAQEFVGKEVHRHNLTGIHITKKGEVIATNGHLLFFCNNQLIEPVALDSNYTLALNGKIPKGVDEISITGNIAHCYSYQKGGLVATIPFEIIDMDYPKWENVLPTGKPQLEGGEITVDPKYVDLVCKVFGGGVKMQFHGEFNSIKVTPVKEDANDNTFALIMPMRK